MMKNECIGKCSGSERKKYPCPDCNYCQFCSEVRCNLCRGTKIRPLKLSLAEQIELYERLNREEDNGGVPSDPGR